MMQSRKTVLDRNKKELIETINTENKVYTNEELSILVNGMKNELKDKDIKITDLTNQLTTVDSKYKTISNELKARNLKVPIGEVNLFIGDFYTESTTYQNFNVSYNVKSVVTEKYGTGENRKYKVCREYTDSTCANRMAILKITFANGVSSEFTSNLWGAKSNAIVTTCYDIDAEKLNIDGHWNLAARTTSGDGFRIYRVYLQVFEN